MGAGNSVEENEAMFNKSAQTFPKHAGIQTVVKLYRENVANANKPQNSLRMELLDKTHLEITMPDVNGKSFSSAACVVNMCWLIFGPVGADLPPGKSKCGGCP